MDGEHAFNSLSFPSNLNRTLREESATYENIFKKLLIEVVKN